MFVKFSNIEEPNAIDQNEARWLHEQLLRGTPPVEATQAALKIQRGWENGVDVALTPDEKRQVVAILNEAASPGHTITEALRWVQQNTRRSLGEDVV